MLRREAWVKFQNTMQGRKSREEFVGELRKVLTESEIAMLEKRLAISILLKQGKSYREIGRMIDVTPQTISYIKHHFTRKHAPRPQRREYRKENPYYFSVVKELQKAKERKRK